ncbi:MAG TPA: hypothetical protein DDZ39_05420 [Flavobacteriaceae bacterium]|jgi:hypothetical protein|nr:hypothetical protein [Flavobacteriaceae bacterium]
MKKPLLSVLLVCVFLYLNQIAAQEYFPKNDGVKTTNTNYTAFTNAKIIVSPTQTIDKGTLIIKDGKIVQVGANIIITKN